MTAREAQRLLDKIAYLEDGEMQIAVKIVDVREMFGRVDLLVAPVAGKGQTWKSEGTVKVQKGGGK